MLPVMINAWSDGKLLTYPMPQAVTTRSMGSTMHRRRLQNKKNEMKPDWNTAIIPRIPQNFCRRERVRRGYE